MSNPSPEDIVAAARMAVHHRHPYLGQVLFALRPHPAPGLGTMAVDQGWRLYYDPEIVIQWYEQQKEGRLNKIAGTNDWHDGVDAVIFHELGHVIREHFKRTQPHMHPVAANYAQDREINDDVCGAGWRLPVKALMPADIGMDDGLTFEEYYRPPIEIEVKIKGAGCPGCGGACGGISGNPTQWEKENNVDSDARSIAPGEGAGSGPSGAVASPSLLPNPAGSMEQEIVLRKTAQDIQDAVKGGKHRGTIPSGLKAWSETFLRPPKVDWRKKLAGLTRQAIASCAGAVDSTWQRIGRRALYAAGMACWPIAPALFQPIPRVAVVLDTSGSMDSKGNGDRSLLQEALSEVLGIVKAAGGDCWGVACDADVHAVARIRRAADLIKLNKGSGDTNMRRGFNAAKKTRPDVVVICTDALVGDGWPSLEDCRGIRTIAAVVGGHDDGIPDHIKYVEVE